MVKSTKLLIVASLLTIVVQLDGVSVNPSLCPTNKIAPHRRAVSWADRSEQRTLGLLNSLLTPSRPRPPYVNNHNELQEKPQEDDPNDCGDIEDYDETDLSSITPGAQNYNNYNKKEFGYNTPSYPERIWNWLPYRLPPTKKPQRQTPSVKPPFSSGGIYESHVYRPPSHHNPSNNIKPVHEYNHDRLQDMYRPSFVGAKPEQVFGYPVRPIPLNGQMSLQKRPNKSIRFPDSGPYSNRRTRAKPPYVTASVIGSFVDLLFN